MSSCERDADDLPDIVTLADLRAYGITRADVRRRCPPAVEYGTPRRPYWRGEDLAGLLLPDAEEGLEP
jgi:hypothetical protein